MIFINSSYAQNVEKSIMNLFYDQPTQIVFWKSNEYKYFSEDNRSFQSILLEYKSNNNVTKRFELVSSNLKIYSLGDNYYGQKFTYFYYIPNEFITISTLKIRTPTNRIDYWTNDIGFVNEDTLKSVRNSILINEDIIFNFNKYSLYNARFVALSKLMTGLIIIPSAILAYVFYKNNMIGGYQIYSATAAGTALLISIQFPKYIMNKFRLRKLKKFI